MSAPSRRLRGVFGLAPSSGSRRLRVRGVFVWRGGPGSFLTREACAWRFVSAGTVGRMSSGAGISCGFHPLSITRSRCRARPANPPPPPPTRRRRFGPVARPSARALPVRCAGRARVRLASGTPGRCRVWRGRVAVKGGHRARPQHRLCGAEPPSGRACGCRCCPALTASRAGQLSKRSLSGGVAFGSSRPLLRCNACGTFPRQSGAMVWSFPAPTRRNRQGTQRNGQSTCAALRRKVWCRPFR